MQEIAELSDRLIVMSQLSSQFLQEIFKVPGSKIDMVPHGVPDLLIPDEQGDDLALPHRAKRIGPGPP